MRFVSVRMLVSLVVVALAVGGVAPGEAAAQTAKKMYRTDTGFRKIQRANLDGTGVQDLVTGPFSLRGLALDVAGGKLYWTAAGKIQRANLDGSGVQDLVTGLVGPFGIALDLSVGGWAHGFQPTKVVCKNVTTRQRATITLPPGALFTDCAAAGLTVKPGDQLKVAITGSEP